MNVIDGSTMAAIRVGPEFFWSESGFSRNLVLRNNTIRNVAYWGNQAAAMLISPEPAPLPSRGYQNLTIEGNTFENFDITAIFISSADGVTIIFMQRSASKVSRYRPKAPEEPSCGDG